MLTSLLFATSFGKTIWELEGPMTFDLTLGDLVDLGTKLNPNHIVTQDQMDNALHKTNCSAFVAKHPMKANGSKKCWNYMWSTPKGCPGSGWVKYSDFHVIGTTVGHAGVSVDEHNHLGMTVSDVSFHVKKTPFTVQEKGIFTFPCSGVIDGVISGAVSAVEAVVKLSAEGVPVIGEAAASPVDGVVMDLKHALTGLCGMLEDIIEDALGLIEDVLGAALGADFGAIIQQLLSKILGLALGTHVESAPALSAIAESKLQLREGWTRIL